MRVRLFGLGPTLLILAAGLCRADVPTAPQDCRNRNAALCEIRGVTYMVEGPCPAGAKTLRPPGHEDCDHLPLATVERGQPEPGEPLPRAGRGGGTDLAWLGGVERWLIPAVVAGFALLVGALVLFALRAWIRPSRDPSGERRANLASHALRVLVAGATALPLAALAAKLALARVINSFGNHDTMAPAVFALPVALLAFAIVLPLTFTLVWLALSRLFRPPR